MDLEGALLLAAAQFDRQLAAVGEGQWERPCCGEWTVRHPAGEMPARWLAVTSVEELAVHGWDVASATGGDATIDEAVAEWLLEPLAAIIAPFRAAGRFAEPRDQPSDVSSAAARLLHLTGR